MCRKEKRDAGAFVRRGSPTTKNNLAREDVICGNACVCLRRCDLWTLCVNKHHQQFCFAYGGWGTSPVVNRAHVYVWKRNEIVFSSSMCTVQCGSMEAKALSFVLHVVGSEHHTSSTGRVFTYVVGGRVGMNRPLLFYVRYEET